MPRPTDSEAQHNLAPPNINWHYPPPPPGLRGALDRFIGPGTTSGELALLLLAAGGGGAAVLVYALAGTPGWTLLQTLVALLLAFDLFGGVVTNATSSAKRWYHREEQGWRAHMGFIVIHALQPALVVLAFRPGDGLFFVLVYGYLLLAALAVLAAPLYLRRPLALLLFAGACLLDAYVLHPTAGLGWFVPVFFAKLLVSHLLREEPYRPQQEPS